MASRQSIVCPTRRPKSNFSSEVQLYICGGLFALDKETLAAKSAKIAKLLKEHPQDDLSRFLSDIPADPESFELVGRFCHGYHYKLSTENIVRVACVAHYLGMTESHCSNNLLDKAIYFFEQQILPHWNNSIKALKSAEKVLQQAVKLGLFDACMGSIVSKVHDDPHLLGDPIKNLSSSSDDDDDDDDGCDGKENACRPNARRRLFELDWKSEDLTVLSLTCYDPIIREMIRRQVPQEYVAASLCRYVKKWVFGKEGNGEKEIVESLERLLPHQKGLFPCKFLFEMLKSAISLDASIECKNGLENRIGMQLDQADVKDLLLLSQEYAEDKQYDIECIRRILKNFFSNYASGFIKVAELVDNLLMEIATDIDLKMSTFIAFADMSVAVSEGTGRTSDGIYRAIDIYLDKHRHLTESERETLCRVLDCNKISAEAREHAAQNERLPLRVVVQILFLTQLQLRDTITKEVQGSDDRMMKLEEEAREDETRAEMEMMESKVLELEKECQVIRAEIQRGCGNNGKKQKLSMWKEMKRKLGCMTTMHEQNCHVKKKKKVHPR